MSSASLPAHRLVSTRCGVHGSLASAQTDARCRVFSGRGHPRPGISRPHPPDRMAIEHQAICRTVDTIARELRLLCLHRPDSAARSAQLAPQYRPFAPIRRRARRTTVSGKSRQPTAERTRHFVVIFRSYRCKKRGAANRHGEAPMAVRSPTQQVWRVLNRYR